MVKYNLVSNGLTFGVICEDIPSFIKSNPTPNDVFLVMMIITKFELLMFSDLL